MKTITMSAKRQERIDKMANEVKGLKRKPCLAIVVCEGYDQSSTRYVNNKLKIANEIGIKCVKHNIEWEGLDEIRIFSNILHKVAQLNMNGLVDGIIVQLPLPITKEHEEIICNSIYRQKDVDGFHRANLGKMIRGS